MVFGARRGSARLALAGSFGVVAAAAAVWALSGPGRAQQAQLDLREVFACRDPGTDGQAFCDRARELIIRGCDTCHSFLMIVSRRYSPEAWVATVRRMSPNARGISEEEAGIIERYLATNLTPDVPVPQAIRELN